MPEPRFSVVIAAYQAAGTIGDAIQSNLAQDYAGWHEVVVVDDGSSDRTAEAAAAIDDPRVRVLRLPQNRGRAYARNAGVSLARGDVVVPCDADDRSFPGRLSAHAAAFGRAPSAEVVFGRIQARTPRGEVRHWPVMPDTTAGVDDDFLRGQMGVAHGASAFRREWFERVGGYDPGLRVAEDYDLFARGWEPGRFVPHEEFVLEYAVPGVFPAWDYWWQNERHRRAITQRAWSGGEREPIGPYLARTSTRPRKLVEAARYTAHRVLDAVRD
ncbi:glycosyltransferase family 2 protein [Leifsonia sp. AG29]|uniref:glycosyltransferase family 2 protein n=1 Tax=Leifsonia sp. AG29 TaxID=2598860 RepID=UPI00131B105E|nr:glycosyltransferase [Leifsonia sp. AG29]